MTKTKKNLTFHERLDEQRLSRLKMTKNFIYEKNLSGLLNNTKWQEIFGWLWTQKTQFEIKLLLSDNSIICNHIYELENTSILIDHTGNFIEFLEIEALIVSRNGEIEKFLGERNVEYIDHSEKIRIDGYR